MRRCCIAMLVLVSSPWLSRAQGQQQGQGGTPLTSQSTESEISTRSTDTSIKVQVNLVQVLVVVKDARGKIVPDLKQEDFQVLDNGKKEKISAFSLEEEATPGQIGPKIEGKIAEIGTGEAAEAEAGTGAATLSVMPKRFVALVFDDAHMKAADAMAVRAATQKLFASMTPTDRVAIYSTTGTVQQDFTADAEVLRKTLASVVPHPAPGEGQYQCPSVSYYQADLILNKHDREAILAAAADAQANACPVNLPEYAEQILRVGDLLTSENYESLENIVRQLAGMPGRRVLAYVSPGFVLGDEVLPRGGEWIEQAVRSGVVVNTIDARGLYTADVMPDISAPPQRAPRKTSVDYQGMEGTFRIQAQLESGQVLADMAAATGGTFFHNRNDLDIGISQAMAAPSVSYMLGFAPQNPKLDGKLHKLKVVVRNGKKYQIQARNGYYASKTPIGDPKEMAKQAVREALLSQDEVLGIPLKLETESLKVDATSAKLTVVTNLDVRRIRFRKVDGLSCNDLVLATGLFDSNGHLVSGEMKEIALKLKNSTVEELSKTGLPIKGEFTVKPGTYRVRSVVRGSEGDQLTARNLVTVIPAKQSNETAQQSDLGARKASGQDLQWVPPTVDAHLKSVSMTPPCDLPDLLQHAAANASTLASNLEKFTAQEHIAYVVLDRTGMVKAHNSGSFEYVYSMEQQAGGFVSREYRTALKGNHGFRAAGLDIGEVAIALIFHPDLQTDYEMKCEGAEERNGQLDWVVHFQQRKDKPSRTAKFWVDDISYPGNLKGRAWISNESFQIVHLEANLMRDVPEIGLKGLAFSVDYGLVQSPSGNLGLWLPNHNVTYWDFDPNRIILTHTLADFQFFAVDAKEKIQQSKEP